MKTINPADKYSRLFVVPGECHTIDFVNPETGRSFINDETLEQIRERYPAAIEVDFDEWHQNRTAQLNGPVVWDEITQEQYDEWLNCLPPVCFKSNSFMMGEPSDHFGAGGRARYQACVHKGTQYFASSRAMTVGEFQLYLKIN